MIASRCPSSLATVRTGMDRNNVMICHRIQHQSTSTLTASKCMNSSGSGKVANIQGTIPSRGEGMQVRQYAELHRSYSQHDVNKFASLIGDYNPVHFPSKSRTNNESDVQHNNAQTSYNKPIVHGMLLSSVFSTIFGTLIPGCVYRSQSLKYYQPVYIDEAVCGRVVVTKLRQINRSGGGVLCTCDTTVTKHDKDANSNEILCISGEAQVWLPGVRI